MSKMAELAMEIDALVEKGMTAKFISATLGIPYQWAEQAVIERSELELQKQQEFMSYGDE